MTTQGTPSNGDNGLKRDEEAIALAEEPDFQLGELLVRPSLREIIAVRQSEKLEPRVMQVLIALARRRGEVVSREQLVASCWEGRVISEDAINRAITKVRRLATPATFTLETIPRVGYRLIEADKPFTPPIEPLSATAPPAKGVPVPTRPRYSRRKKIWIGVGVVVGLWFVVGGWFGYQMMRDASRPFFAVLHFDVTSDDAQALKIADAIAATVNHRLTSQGFRVVSPAQSAKFRGAAKAGASALGSRFLIDGNVRIDDDRVHVTVRVDATVKPMTVWTRTFDVETKDAQRLPENISTVLAGLFNPTMQSGPVNPPEVTAGMLRINALRFQGNDLEAYIAAKQFLRDTPGHYTPQIWYASSVAEALDQIPNGERAVELSNARRNAEQADAMVWNSLPTVYFGLTPPVEWSKREKMLRAGLDEQFSDGPTVRSLLATVLIGSGRVTEAIDLAKQATVMFSMSARNAAGYASVLEVAGRHDQALAALERAAQTWPNVEFIERLRFGSALARGDLDAASSLLSDSVTGSLIDPPAERRPWAALIRALSTRSPADIAEVERDCADPVKLARDRAPWCLQGLVALGRVDTFFRVAPLYFPEQRGETSAERDQRWLEAPRAGRYVRVLFRSDMQPVRADPRFIPIVERLGLVEFWRSSGKWPDFCKTEPESVCGLVRANQ